jgi:hypothetical protein
MPITVTAPRGVLTPEGEERILPELTEALIAASGMTGVAGFLDMVGGTVHVLEPRRIYGGGTNRPLVMVELKLPNIGLPTVEARAAFIKAAADIVDRLTEPGHQAQDTWINILNAPDGAWGIGSTALTNDDLIARLSAAAA